MIGKTPTGGKRHLSRRVIFSFCCLFIPSSCHPNISDYIMPSFGVYSPDYLLFGQRKERMS